jgi:malate dehydrogenase (oxaloacetate-decarboxylating)(NADP+)
MDSSPEKKEELRQQLRAAALEYHEIPRPGKISVTPTKQLLNQRDLALAYSPGVAAPCEEIVKDPSTAYKYTSRGNLVAVISNGTAVLGLGNIGPLASKPVMEGKGVLFKKFAGIDVFYIERQLRERMKIPVFHDDQHGTAIIVGAAILNGLKVVGKDLKRCKLVVSGAGAAALACLDLIVDLGFPIENIYVTDLAGVVYKGRVELMDPDKERFAQDTPHRTLSEVIPDADIFLGLSAGGVLKPDMVAKMAPNPLILALANPNPEILPEEAKAVRSDVIIATGRSDYPNQVNNVLCFPYMFRGALDCGATTITREMEIAVVHAIADLAHAEQSDIVASAYGISNLSFGPEYLIPMPFDPRLLTHIAPAVAKAAMEGGVATRPIADLAAYAQSLQQFVYRSGTFMKPIFSIAKNAPAEQKRIVYAEGEDERVLRAVQVVVDEGLARPILVGRPAVLEKRIEKFGLRLKLGQHFDVINPDFDERYRDYWQTYFQIGQRRGVTQEWAKLEMRRRHTLIGAMMIHKGDADGMICGTLGTVNLHLHFIDQVLGKRAGSNTYAAMNFVITQERQLAVVDTHVNENPSAEQLAEITVMAAEEMERFGILPRVALLSHSNFGSANSESSQKMRATLGLVQQKRPNLEIDGEMHGDTALDSKLRSKLMPNSTLKGDANLLVMPNIEAANISYNLLKTAAGNGIAIGPVLLGCARAVHILTPSATVRRIVNMTALCVVDAVSER